MSQTPDRHRRMRSIFEQALLQELSTRQDFVDHACGSDPELRPDVMRLLAAHQDAHSFLEHPPQVMLSAVRAVEHFPGTARFQVTRQLGAGGMGVVYEVHDRVRDEVVALKTLLRTSAADLYRLKREFRSLADLAHPNLVCLYELFVEDERCFFTMELVRGSSFVDYARGASSYERLVHALRQLIDGVAALHVGGKLHRDIKPSNVLVTPEGRVVILDFGLIAELLPQHARDVNDAGGGTPAYMAPEARSGAPPSEASDWYGVGVTLYEALTGSIPPAGTLLDMPLGTRTDDPPAPAQMVPDVPADLSAVCMALLRRNPQQRLSGPEALRELIRDAAAPVSTITPAASRDPPFVGRDRQLQVLNDAFAAVMNGGAAAVSVCGPSGIGKSALVRRFLSRFGTRDDIIVLSGRCYANESVPYKALDGVVDEVSRYLASMPRQHVERLMPPDVSALTQVFPVLLQVSAIENARRNQELGNVDPLGLRRLAFAALRELLRRLADRHSLIVCIDDLHWADADSVDLLEELLQPPTPPAMLTVLCFRSEETAQKPFLQALLDKAGSGIWSAIALEPMTEDEAHTLIGALLPSHSTLTVDDKTVMTREASGSPFVLEQLARYVGVEREPSQRPTFAEMFASRLAALSPETRRFLETLAICGRPMAPELVCNACGVTGEGQSLVAMLRSAHFIRSSGSAERIETYHDRIREALAAAIAPDAVPGIHRLIIRALVDQRSDDCEALFEHYRGAGDRENASIQAGLAAAKAAMALAFDRAASFYRHALALTPASSFADAWREAVATALANAGRPEEAADAYLLAASAADHTRRVDLQRRAAEQFLIGGHIDRGLDLIRTMLGGLGVHVPGSPRSALLWLVWRRVRLRWRGLGFVPTPAGDIDADALLRVDACWSATMGLALVDLISASELSVHGLLMALDAGEPYRIARSMAFERAARGAYPSGSSLSERLLQQSKEIARSVGNPHAIALPILVDALIASAMGEWKRAGTCAKQALAILRDQCVGVTWELNMAQNVAIWALMYQGELGEVRRQVPPLLANARSSGNLYIATELCTRSNYAWLAADEPDEGEREAIESIARWSQKGFHRQHYSAMLARVQTALYRGDGEAAWQLLAEHQSRLRRSLLTRVQVLRVESIYMRARAALTLAGSSGRPHRFLRVARAGARRIARDRMPWSDPIALLVRAGIAHLEGKVPLALSHLHDAAGRFDRADMKLYAAVARRRIGALQNDARGRELWCQAEEWMAGQNIRNPRAFTRMLAPGFPDLP